MVGSRDASHIVTAGNQAHGGLADRVRGLPQTEIRRMFDLAAEYDGDLANLALGEPDFDTPEHVVEAAHEAARNGHTHYTGNCGIQPLREAIADYHREQGASVDPDRVAVTAGGIQAAYFAFAATVDPGDDVVLPTPGWPSYYTQAAVFGADLVEVPMPADDGFALDADRVADAVTDDTAMVVLNTPNNPTGRVFDADAVRRVVDAAAAHDAYVLADEVYGKLVYDRAFDSALAVADDDRVLLVNSMSKTYAMTGWRVGWLVAPPEVVGVVPQLQQATSTCAASVSQHAAVAALDGPQEPVREMYDAFRERRDYVADRVADLPLDASTPEGGFYAFLDVRALDGSSVDVAERLLQEYGVVTVPGSGFGDVGEGFLRLSFANSLDRIEVAFDRVEAMVADELGR
jgi:aspartate aminotransferase